MRYRVDTRYGYASFDAGDEAKARDLYAREGIRLIWCKDFDDPGIVVEGVPLNELKRIKE